MNDVILSWLALDVITDNDSNKNKQTKESLFLPGLCLFLFAFVMLFAILYRLGISQDQLKTALLIITAPFLWDYYINFAVVDITNNQHILAAVGSIIASFALLIVLEWIKELYKRLAVSRITSVQSFAYVLHSNTMVLRWSLQAVLMVSIFKLAIHSILALLLWLF